MFVLIPASALLFLSMIFQKEDPCLRRSILSAAVAWAVLLVLITEVLSVFRALTFTWLLALWGIITLILFIIYLRFPKNVELIARFRDAKIPLVSRVLALCVVLTTATLGLIAWIAPPNNTDSLVYHMSRVVHWSQNHSVAHYPTHISRELYLNPGAEFIITHFQILSGGDRFANLVQWSCMIGSICGASLIAKQLGANARGQIFAAVVVVAIPMGILQATSTQNDFVVSFWLTCFVYFLILLKSREVGQPVWGCSLLVGGSLGLAILTKGTAYIFAFPFCLWFALSGIKTSFPRLWKSTLIITIVVLSMNLGHYTRNYTLYHSPLGLSEEGPAGSGYKFTNDIFTVTTLVSNSARNIGLHMGTPSERVNALSERIIYKAHRILGLSVNDPRTTWAGTRFERPALSWHEDLAGNPLHLALILLSVGALFFSRQLRGRRNLVCYAITLIVACLLFTLLLRWQPWHARLHLPLFVLWSPFIAVVLSTFGGQKIADWVAAVLLISALSWVGYNKSRPLIGSRNIFNTSRIRSYFNNAPDLEKPYLEATDIIKSRGCSEIGIVTGGNASEYPLWPLLQHGNEAARITHVVVRNISATDHNSEPADGFAGCALIFLDSEQAGAAAIETHSDKTLWSSGPITVVVK